MISIAYPAFYGSFKQYYPYLTTLYTKDGNINYSLIDKSDLIIFSGGEDISPAIYGEKNIYSHVNIIRDEIEIEILRVALQLNKKLLGVCRGHQLINAYLGGKLAQDISAQLNIYHAGNHPLTIIKEESITNSYFLLVNSMHHQGVIEAGKGLIPTSYHKGVIESTESENIISVQFHPEFMTFTTDFFSYLKEWANVQD